MSGVHPSVRPSVCPLVTCSMRPPHHTAAAGLLMWIRQPSDIGHYLPTVILIIIGIPAPTHSFTLGLNPSFSANPPYRSLSFFSFRIHYMDSPDCLLLLLSISVFLLFRFFSVFTLF